jgi:hypothetical protein
MKRSILPFLIAGVCLFSVPSLAEEGKSPGNAGDAPAFQDGRGEPDGKGSPMMRADKDGDGFITEAEMLEAHRAKVGEMFSKLDGNKDGKLAPEEMAKGRQMMRDKMRERMQDRPGMGEGKGMGQNMTDEERQEFRDKMRERMRDRMDSRRGDDGPPPELDD